MVLSLKFKPLDPMYVGLIDDKETVIQSINTLGQYQQFLLQKKDELQREINKIKVNACLLNIFVNKVIG